MMGKAGFLGKKKSNPSLTKPQACSAVTVLVIQLFQIYCIFRIFSEGNELFIKASYGIRVVYLRRSGDIFVVVI